MTAWSRAIRRFASDRRAVISMEYALLGSLIAVACFLAVMGLGEAVAALYTDVCNGVSTAISGQPAC